MYLDCMYIAGYAPECALKALLLAHVPAAKRGAYAREEFRGAMAHDYEHLKNLLRKIHVNMPSTVIVTLRKIASWSTDLRYEFGRKKPREATVFLQAAATVVDWVERSV